MRKILFLLPFIPLVTFGQVRTVSNLGVEKIDYGFVKYEYDGNPFNDNEKSLSFDFGQSGNWRSDRRVFCAKLKFTIEKSDIEAEKFNLYSDTFFCDKGIVAVKFKSTYGVKIGYADIKQTRFFEFIFDNDKNTYFKLDKDNYKEINTFNHELFLKLKKHNSVIIRSNITYTYNDPIGWDIRGNSLGHEKIKETRHNDTHYSLRNITSAINKYLDVEEPTVKNKNKYKVVNGLANVNPFNLDKYIDKFILDAKTNHNIDLSYVNKRDKLIMFRELEGETIAAAYKMNDDGKVLVIVDPENWQAANQSKRWYIIYHELGHDILNLEHGECGPMMKETANGNYSWDRLEKDKNTMFETYKTKL